MATVREISYFNSFVVKKLVRTQDGIGGGAATWPGLPWNPTGYPTFPLLATTEDDEDSVYGWYVEESRIRGGYNNDQVDLGVRAYIRETNDSELILSNGIIYSGLYNSTTGFNDTNVFSVSEKIEKQLDPRYGPIQKLHTTDTNLIIFQNDKVSNTTVDKDTIYTGDGNAVQTASDLVLGTVNQYAGEYGISTNPESFSFKGNRLYFSDKNRGAIMRLSLDGLTEISSYGMRDYFRDKLADISETTVFSPLVNLIAYTGQAPGGIRPFPTNSLVFSDSATGLLKNLELGMQCPSSMFGNSGVYIHAKQSVGSLTGDLSIPTGTASLSAGTYTTIPVVTSRFVTTQVVATVNITVSSLGSISRILVQSGGTLYSAGDLLTIPGGSIGGSTPSDNIEIAVVEANLTAISSTQKRVTFDRVLNYLQPFSPATFSPFSFYNLISDKVIGGYDNYYDNYVVSMQKSSGTYDTISFADSVNGWTSFWDYKPSFIDTINNIYYSVESANIWKHYNQSVINNRGYFYGTYYPSSVELTFNNNPSVSKNFNTVGYEGTNGWQVDYFLSDPTGATTLLAQTNNYKDETSSIYSYDEGVYTEDGITYRVGFNRKENKYVANLINKGVLISGSNETVSFGQPGQVVPGISMSGIKGFFATVKLSTDNTTDLGGSKNLFSVYSNFVKS